MLVIGLTGSIGMGKSTAAARFRELGIAVCDADAEVHKLYEGGPAVHAIEAAFPGTTTNGRVDRQMLAQVLLANPSQFARLESIVHPMVREAERDFLRAEMASDASMAVLEIPLLLEGGGHGRVDVVVVVSAPADIQRERVLARPGMSLEKLEQILARQLHDGEKRARADFVVDTGGTLAESAAQVDNIVESLQGRRGEAYAKHWA
jgi:dephospho-CoA kinase